MTNPITSLIAAVAEAWSELRVNRGRVIVSLIGVVIAVAALTAAVALGNLVEQGQREQSERWGGRAATLAVSMWSSGPTPLSVDDATAAVREAADRYNIGHLSRRGYTSTRVQLPTGVIDVQTLAVDLPHATMFRNSVPEGRWFVEKDGRQLAPRVLINEVFWERLGKPDLRTHVTLTVLAPNPVTVVVVGVSDPGQMTSDSAMVVLADDLAKLVPAEYLHWFSYEYYLWVPPEHAQALQDRLQSDISGSLPAETTVDIRRSDYAANVGAGEDPFATMRTILGMLSGLVLFLGALGLVNVALVTVRQRIREIGVRRAIGATAGRVFFVAVAENVVATALAGMLGVFIPVLGYQLPAVRAWLNETAGGAVGGLFDFPPFPAEAALTGFIAATAVGALVGLIPALVATRVRVIDAIRF